MRYEEPEFLPWDGRRVPMTFISGYLGAGKTTLINELLARTDRPIAVLVNDVGAVNIDARLLRKRSGDTIELNDGCICCSLSEGFGFALDQLRARPFPPDHVVVELSGVAEPAKVLPWAKSAGFVLDGVVTLVDVDQVEDRLADPISAHTIGRQLEVADLVLLTKLGLARHTDVERWREQLSPLAPNARVLLAPRADEVVGILQLGGRRPEGEAATPPVTLFDQHTVLSYELPDPIESDALHHLLDGLPSTTVRAKGIARDSAGSSWLIQIVGRRRSVTAVPMAEAQVPTDLVVITV